MIKEFERLRTFITNESGKWVSFPLTEEETNEIKDFFETDFDQLRVCPSEIFYLDDKYRKKIVIDTRNMNIQNLNELALSIKKYTETSKKNAFLKDLEKQGTIVFTKSYYSFNFQVQ